MKRLKLYLETSVWNFYHADDAADKKDITRRFFDEVKLGKYEICVSRMVVAEFSKAPDDKQRRLMGLLAEFQPFELENNAEVEELSNRYISANIVPTRYKADVIHVAFAVAHDLDVVVSWNLQHIVKLKTRLEVNGINKLAGYKEIEICTPEEVIENHED